MRKCFTTTAVVLLLAFMLPCCKKESTADLCIKNFVGAWNCSLQSQSNSGMCSEGTQIDIQPGPDGNCQVLLPNLPVRCYNSSNQVLGTVSGDSLFINEQPFGLETMHASGRLYLNQLTLKMYISDGTVNTLSGTK